MAKKRKETGLKDQSVQELEAMAHDLSREIYLLRSELSVNRKLEKPHQLKAKKKDRARVLTLLTQKQRGQDTRKGA